MIRAVIDIGSHSVLLLLAKGPPDRPEVVLEEYRVTALGCGLGRTGRISEEATARTRRVIDHYLERCRGLAADRILLVGTFALREAKNRDRILTQLSRSSGPEIRVLSQKEEAELTRRGALSGLDAPEDALVIDLGGRSTEMSGPRDSLSLPVGCQWGSEDFLLSDPPAHAQIDRLREQVRRQLPELPPAGPPVVSGGTATTLACMDLELPGYRAGRVHGHRMSQKRLAGLIRKLVEVPVSERRTLLGIEPGRAGVLPAGSVILDELCRWCRQDSFLISARGLTWGVWLARS
jgi:exopolyphosphatase/guanosine-5'-triphosphate,3'-diphosphate pyrophosphatase